MSGGSANRFSLVLVIMAMAAGCTADRSIVPRIGMGEDRTGGLRFTMLVRWPDGAIAQYRVQRDGTISFGGGADALNDRYSWSGPLTDEEIATLQALVDRHEWFRKEPASTGEPADLRWRVTAAGPEGRRRFDVRGQAPALAEIQAVLDQASLRRLKPFLDSLPQPGPQP